MLVAFKQIPISSKSQSVSHSVSECSHSTSRGEGRDCSLKVRRKQRIKNKAGGQKHGECYCAFMCFSK